MEAVGFMYISLAMMCVALGWYFLAACFLFAAPLWFMMD